MLKKKTEQLTTTVPVLLTVDQHGNGWLSDFGKAIGKVAKGAVNLVKKRGYNSADEFHEGIDDQTLTQVCFSRAQFTKC